MARTRTRRGPPMFAAVTDDAPRGDAQRARRLRGLYAVTPDLADTADLVARVEAAIAGGATAIQYRNKTADAATRRLAGRGARPRGQRRAARCSSSTTTPRSPRAVDADGVHLGEDDGSVAAARSALGAGRDRRRFVLQRFRARGSRGRGRRRLRRLREFFRVGREAARAARRACRCSQRGASSGRAGGRDRRHHGGQCGRAHRGRRRRGRRHQRGVRCARRSRRRARRAGARRRDPPRRMSPPGRLKGEYRSEQHEGYTLSEPLVSVITRTLGRPSLADVAACLVSQTHRQLEWIVVNARGQPLPEPTTVPGVRPAWSTRAGRCRARRRSTPVWPRRPGVTAHSRRR